MKKVQKIKLNAGLYAMSAVYLEDATKRSYSSMKSIDGEAAKDLAALNTNIIEYINAPAYWCCKLSAIDFLHYTLVLKYTINADAEGSLKLKLKEGKEPTVAQVELLATINSLAERLAEYLNAEVDPVRV